MREPVDAVYLALEEARRQVDQLQQELEETNRGVLALYAELDDRALKLKRADELKSKFLSYASHELRTPLNGVIGLARLLLARQPQGEERKQTEFILRAAQEMREMVDDLLDLAKVEAGKITIHASEVGLELIFGALRGMFRPLASSGSVELHFEDTSAIPLIYTDESKVVQILRNFISNALKFTEQGEIRVWSELGPGNSVRISVQDTGIGIPLEHQGRVFEEFSQVDNPLQKRAKGTGLGLPLCKKLAEVLGGHVELRSTPGVGSTLTLVLPIVYHPSSASEPQPMPIRGFTILHVEGGVIDRYLVQQLLRSDRHLTVMYAVDGVNALETVRVRRPDLILLDSNVMRISAADFLQALDEATGANLPPVPVVVLTPSYLETYQDALVRSRSLAILSKDDLAEIAALTIDPGPPVRVSLEKSR
ncbi:MAG: hypothetical protein JNK87_06115 [Bryobacterales bacterium]|nr:hypothetical protein [Bryobacterales bacterium]